MRKMLLIILLSVAGISQIHAARPRTVNKVKKEQQTAKKKISENTHKLDANTRETQRNLNELSVLKAEITDKNREISSVKAHIDSIDSDIRSASDSLQILSDDLAVMKEAYIKSLRSLQGSQPVMDAMGFVFSSRSFSKAYARMRYVREFAAWRRRKARAINETSERINLQRRHLDSLNAAKRGSLVALNARQSELEQKRQNTDRVVKELNRERSKIKNAIAAQKRQMQQLDRELQKLEREAEQRRRQEAAAKAKNKKAKGKSKGASGSKANAAQMSGIAAADRALTGGFERNRGNLLLPVSGRYTVVRPFGAVRHPEIANIETTNTGVDILVPAGTKARCVYDGEVSAVMWQNDNAAIILIRHGDYRSVYQYIASPVVKTGDKVKTNQVIGTVAPHADYRKRPVLHFEIRKGRAPLSPMKWVK